KTVSNRDKENQQLTNRILEIYHESKRRYGAPKIHYLLNQEGYNVSLKRVQRLMKKVDIQSITVKKFRPTPSKEKVVERDNLLQRDLGHKLKMKNGLAISLTSIHFNMAGAILHLSWIYILRRLLVFLLIV